MMLVKWSIVIIDQFQVHLSILIKNNLILLFIANWTVPENYKLNHKRKIKKIMGVANYMNRELLV